MGSPFRNCFAIAVCVLFSAHVYGQCPDRPASGTVVNDAYSISSQNGVLSANFTMAESVDTFGYTHYCYKYAAGNQIVEAPTLRVNSGDQLNLDVTDRIQNPEASTMKMDMSPAGSPVCGDTGAATVSSTNVHFHGMNVPPKCHQDDVINTLIQPGSPGFKYGIQVPRATPDEASGAPPRLCINDCKAEPEPQRLQVRLVELRTTSCAVHLIVICWGNLCLFSSPLG